MGLAVRQHSGLNTTKAAALTRIGSVTVHTVDALGQSMLQYDTAPRTVTMALRREGRSPDTIPLENAVAQTRDGTVTLRNVTLRAPQAGQYRMRLSTAGLAAVDVPLYIRAGTPAALFFIVQPSAVTDNAHILSQQPVLGLRDSAGHTFPCSRIAMPPRPLCVPEQVVLPVHPRAYTVSGCTLERLVDHRDPGRKWKSSLPPPPTCPQVPPIRSDFLCIKDYRTCPTTQCKCTPRFVEMRYGTLYTNLEEKQHRPCAQDREEIRSALCKAHRSVSGCQF